MTITRNTRLAAILLTVIVLLLIPFTAMQFTSEVTWSAFDFIAASILLLGTGLACEVIIRKVSKLKYRIAICAAVLLILLIIWAELAVGIFGTPFAGS